MPSAIMIIKGSLSKTEEESGKSLAIALMLCAHLCVLGGGGLSHEGQRGHGRRQVNCRRVTAAAVAINCGSLSQ